MPRSMPGAQLIDDGCQQALGMVGAASQEVISRGAYSAPRLVAAESDRQVEKFRGRGRRSAATCGVGGGIERLEGGVIRAGRGEGEVAGLEFGLGLDGGERPVHGPPPRRGRVGVDAARQQGWENRTRSPWTPTIPSISTSASSPAMRSTVVSFARARRSIVGAATEATASSTLRTSPSRRPIRSRTSSASVARQLGLRLHPPAAHCPRQLQRVKRVAAGHFGDPHHDRTGQWPAEPGRDDRVQTTEAQRAELDAGDVVGRADPQPRRHGALVGITPLAEQHRRPGRGVGAPRTTRPRGLTDPATARRRWPPARVSPRQAVDDRGHGSCRLRVGR